MKISGERYVEPILQTIQNCRNTGSFASGMVVVYSIAELHHQFRIVEQAECIHEIIG